MHAKKDLYFQSNILLLADALRNFQNMLKYMNLTGRLTLDRDLDPARFLTEPGLVWQAPLKKISICY